MTILEKLNNESIIALRANDKFRRTVITTLAARIKKAAIDAGIRDDISDDFVEKEILRAKKEQEDAIQTCPTERANLLDLYNRQLAVIKEFAPQVINDEEEIRKIILDSGVFTGKASKGAVMKYLKNGVSGVIDMKVAAKVFEELVK